MDDILEMSGPEDMEQSEKMQASPKRKGMPVVFPQNTAYGCGSYCLANILNDSRYIQELPRNGESTLDLNEKLSLFGEQSRVITLALTVDNVKENRLLNSLILPIPYWTTENEVLKDTAARCYMMIVNKGSNHHYIGVAHNFKNDMYYVVDSTCSRVSIMYIDELFAKHWIVGFEYFTLIGNDNQEAAFNKEALSHIIPKGE